MQAPPYRTACIFFMQPQAVRPLLEGGLRHVSSEKRQGQASASGGLPSFLPSRWQAVPGVCGMLFYFPREVVSVARVMLF